MALAFEYISEDDLKSRFEDSKKFMKDLHEPLDEYERLARNRPHPGISKELPKVTDGTLAALIQDQPMRVVQQIPTGQIVQADDWLKIVGSYILEHEILPNSNQVAELIEKCWALIEKAKTYGGQPAYVQFVNRGDYFGTDWSLPYIKDVLLEPGKLSDKDSDVIFLRTWWSKGQIKAIIAKENMLKKRSGDRGEKYDSTWDLVRLQELIETGEKAKDADSRTAKERETASTNGFLEIVHAFQRGIGAKFYSFAPALSDGENVVRTKVNPDPRGQIPIHFMYSKLDFSNPLGRGAVELSGGMQNLIDSEVQMFQYNRALSLNPPMVKKGDWSSAQAKYKPNALIDLGTDANASFEPLKVDTSGIQQFPENYGLMRSQILNLNSGGGDSSTSATVGNPGFSKTDSGVNALQERLGFSDNYTRKKFEATFQDILETSINLYFAERHGIQELELDQETADKLRKIAPKAVNKDNKIRLDYDEETPKLKFQIDASSSQKKDNADQLEHAQNLLELVKQYPEMDKKNGGRIDVDELTERIVGLIGLEDPEKIVTKPEVDAQGNPVQPEQQPQGMTPEMVQQMIQQAIAEKPKSLSESLSLKMGDFSEDFRQLVQGEVAKQLGIEYAPAGTPTSLDIADKVKASDAAAKVADLHHKEATAATDQKLKASDSAVRVAELSHKEAIAKDAHKIAASSAALDLAQAQHSETTGARDHEFKVGEAEANRKAAAMKPEPKAGATK